MNMDSLLCLLTLSSISLVPAGVYKWGDSVGTSAPGLPLCLCCVHSRKDQTEVASGPGSTNWTGHEWLGNSFFFLFYCKQTGQKLFKWKWWLEHYMLVRIWQLFHPLLPTYHVQANTDHIPCCLCLMGSVAPVVWLLLWVSKDQGGSVQTGPVVRHFKGRYNGSRAVLLPGGSCTHCGLWSHVRLITM